MMNNQPWPLLRQELSLVKGPASGQGAPTYTLHDPVAHRFFRLGWLEMEILSRWTLADPEAIVAEINSQTTLTATADDVQKLAAFIRNNGLSRPAGPADSARLKELAERQKVSPFMFLVKNYLFLRVPLFQPDRFLARTLPLVRPLFTPAALWIIALLAGLGLALVLRQSAFFRRDLEALFSIQGAVMVLVAMGLSKAVHELGHAYAAKLLGLRVPSIGVALMCFYPMLWTDTTEAWKCARREDRLLIGLAGVGAELALAALAALAWLWLGPGLAREMALTLTGVTWISTLAVNANPFMRYDAYYLMSDFFEMPLLQSRAFALAKWRLRRAVLGLPDEPPEALSRTAVFWCVVYAYSTWVYRFFLFLGIAFLVYHMFFKALGLILFLVEIIWFLTWPVLKELREWYRARDRARPTPLGGALILLVVSLFIPWRSSVVAPALMESERVFTYHAPVGGQLTSELPRPGTAVAEGELVLTMASPDLDFRLASGSLARRSLEEQTANAGLAQELWSRYAAQRQELAGLLAEEVSLTARRDRLTFIAPFDGEVRECAEDLAAGQWVAAREPLVLLTGGRTIVKVLAPEEELARLEVGGRGVFLASSGGGGRLNLKVVSISPGAMTELNDPALASTKGGPLPVRPGPQGQLWPERAVYLVRCEVENLDRPPAALTGLANLHGRRLSLAGRAASYLGTALIKESGW